MLVYISELPGSENSQPVNIEVHVVLTPYLGDKEKPKTMGHSLIPQVCTNNPRS